jgi:uncharacterized membrane protein
MGLLDSIGLGVFKWAVVATAWVGLILATIFIPFSFIITIPLMIFLPAITTLLLIKKKQKMPEGCVMVDGKMECKAKGI